MTRTLKLEVIKKNFVQHWYTRSCKHIQSNICKCCTILLAPFKAYKLTGNNYQVWGVIQQKAVPI